ncbi:AmiS/UreI family transporter [Acidiphilium iwatense]|uniref:AmiS/UreI family transporter n=1 Tax=Acidiphilium iwatense TaxID=768198 RepID=A0ABS9E104_9PROT|nr:AmiS/UreI family transporter [Acidiphilium iwatense]MCF3948692.1 AmiS/UreI family transporter [Acidiphilium iwatense]
MLLGLALFWVGAVLFLNGIWLLGKIDDREIPVIDVFVGFVTLAVALYSAFGPGANLATIKAAALTLLFSFTYFWVAWNRWNNADGRGLGWFCLFVAITTVPVFFQGFSTAHTVWDYWFAICWLSWGSLWFLFFLILALRMQNLTRFTGAFCTLQGIYTGWIPGYLLLTGALALKK